MTRIELVEQLNAMTMVEEVDTYLMDKGNFIVVTTTRKMKRKEFDALEMVLNHFGAEEIVPQRFEFLEYRITLDGVEHIIELYA